MGAGVVVISSLSWWRLAVGLMRKWVCMSRAYRHLIGFGHAGHKEMIGHSSRMPIILGRNHGFRCCHSPVVLLENESENLCERPQTIIIGSHTYCSLMRLCVHSNVARAPDAHRFYTMILLGERSQQEPCKLFNGSLLSLLVLSVYVRCLSSWVSCVLSRNGPAIVNVTRLHRYIFSGTSLASALAIFGVRISSRGLGLVFHGN